MPNNKHRLQNLTQSYIDWVIKLGRVKFSILGFVVLASMALIIHTILSFIFISQVKTSDLLRSIFFGLISAPFVVYFFTQLVEKLEKSRAKLADINQQKSLLIETISHELRTPLNGIVVLSQILLDEKLTLQQRNYLQTIYSSAVSLGVIFSDIIDLEKINASRIELCVEETELAKFVQDISNFAELITAQKGLSFKLNYPNNMPQWLWLDSARLNQVLWNLISNAVKFTNQGIITISLEQVNQDTFAFIVEDTGVGIPASELDNIFEMYYQVKSNGYSQIGSGIGLSISRGIARLMGGDLVVSSQLNQGSKFTLTFKAQIAHFDKANNQYLPPKLHILLVEDMEVNIIAIQAMLNRFGYVVDVATSGMEAIQYFERQDYDLILLDINLPDISGCEVAQQLKQKYQEGIYDYLPPLVALTANILQKPNYYQSQGIDYVLRKPLTLNALMECLDTFFGEEWKFGNPGSVAHPEPMDCGCTLNCDLLASCFDRNFLLEQINLIGIKQFDQIFKLFTVQIPTYCEQLNKGFQTWRNNPLETENLVQTAHKIKGACLAVGLCELAKNMEQVEHLEDVEINLNNFYQNLPTQQNILQNWLSKKFN